MHQLALSKVSGLSQQTSDDFDEQAAFLKDWNQHYNQISSGAFKGSIAKIEMDDLSLFWEYTSQTLFQQGLLDTENIALGIPLSKIETGMFCGAPCEQFSLHVYSDKNGFEFISPNHLLIGLIVINRHRLMQLLSADDQYFLNLQTSSARVLPIDQAAYLRFYNLLQDSFEALSNQPELLTNADFKEYLFSQTANVIVESLLTKNPMQHEIFVKKSWQLVTNIRNIVVERMDEPINVAELCQMLDISRRSLQQHFTSALDISPNAYLRALRLNHVRHALKKATSVTEAATHWGFWHFGHFSHEYKKMFGELPSETFKRYQRQN
jgi:AraC family ethanolamine operon transcriptional activator